MKDQSSPLRFQRIVIAAILARLIPVVVLVATVTIYSYLAVPGLAPDQYSSFALEAGRLINITIGTLATLGMAYWAARKPESAQKLHGILVGIVVVMIDLAILFTPGADFSLLNGIAMLLKIIAGALGGYLAEKNYRPHPAGQPESHRII